MAMGGRLALLAASIVATLVVLELGCRLALGGQYLRHWPNLVLDLREGTARYAQQVLSHDPELGFTPRPGNVRPDGTHDADGMRSTPPLAGVADRPLLLATGDSFTYGEEVDDAETWPSQLQTLLRVRVVNGGVGSYGLDQIVLRTERLARTLRPQAIVVSFIADDLRRNELSRFVGLDKPHFVPTADGLALTPGPVPLPRPARQSLSVWHHALGWSALLDAVLSRIGWPEDWPYDSVRALPPGSGERMACPLMKRLATLAVPLLVVAQYDPAAWQGDATAAEQRRQAKAVLHCAEQAGLAVLDTYDTFTTAAGRQATQQLFAPQDHLDARGNAIIARAVADALKRLGIAAP
jgi:lysophospholipase L1-like esterase